MDHPFKVGQEYRNSNGRYEVLSIDEPTMRVRYEDDNEDELSIASQALIWKMWAKVPELKPLVVVEKTRQASKKPPREGAPADSQQERLIAEIAGITLVEAQNV